MTMATMTPPDITIRTYVTRAASGWAVCGLTRFAELASAWSPRVSRAGHSCRRNGSKSMQKQGSFPGACWVVRTHVRTYVRT